MIAASVQDIEEHASYTSYHWIKFIEYVGGMILTKKILAKTKALKEYIVAEFEINDFGELNIFLEIEQRKNKGLFLTRKICLDLLIEIGILTIMCYYNYFHSCY